MYLDVPDPYFATVFWSTSNNIIIIWTPRDVRNPIRMTFQCTLLRQFSVLNDEKWKFESFGMNTNLTNTFIIKAADTNYLRCTKGTQNRCQSSNPFKVCRHHVNRVVRSSSRDAVLLGIVFQHSLGFWWISEESLRAFRHLYRSFRLNPMFFQHYWRWGTTLTLSCLIEDRHLFGTRPFKIFQIYTTL